jgi:hypothetical protein
MYLPTRGQISEENNRERIDRESTRWKTMFWPVFAIIMQADDRITIMIFIRYRSIIRAKD